MAISAKSPCWGDSDGVLLWKYCCNLWLVAVSVDPTLVPPRLGAPTGELLSRALQYLNSIA